MDERRSFELFSSGVNALAKLMHRVETSGVEHLPPDGQGAVISFNHESFIDAPLIVSQVPRRFVRVMAGGPLMSMPVVGDVMRGIGARGVSAVRGRSVDSAATGHVIGELAEFAAAGELVLVLPEGQVKYWNRPNILHKFHTGAVRVAAKAGVPLIPGALAGTMRTVPVFETGVDAEGHGRYLFLPVWLPVKLRVRFGKPMQVDPRAAEDASVAREETFRLREAITLLWQELRGESSNPLIW